MAEIYALIDASLLERYAVGLGEFADYLNREGIRIAQYRDKRGSDETVADALEELRRHYKGTLIVNDRITLIHLADGLHLGQEDLAAVDSDPEAAVAKIRERIGEKILGLSTHNLEEIETANTLDLDYIGLGAYRKTSTKAVSSIGGDALVQLAAHSRHPVAIIGGVRREDSFPETITWKVLGSALFEGFAKR